MDITQRPVTLAKGQWGRLLILSGSSQLAGAAVLNTLGAVRTGLDLVVVAAPERAANAVLHEMPDVVALALLGRHFEKAHLKLLDRFKKYPVLIGSGMTVQPDVQKFLRSVLKEFDGPFVIDGDALHIIAHEKNPSGLWAGKTVILTPNRQEYQLLAKENDGHPAKSIKALAKQLRAIVMCKGPTDIICDGKVVVEMPGGSQFLAKAGTGDVLAGMVAALLARGVPAFDAAKLGQALLRDASLRAEEDLGPSLLASDIPGYIDLRKLRSQTNKGH